MMSGIVGLSTLAAPSAAQTTAEILQPPQPDCMMTTARSRAARLLPALQRGVGLQYWGPDYTVEALAGQLHGLLIFEATRIGAPL